MSTIDLTRPKNSIIIQGELTECFVNRALGKKSIIFEVTQGEDIFIVRHESQDTNSFVGKLERYRGSVTFFGSLRGDGSINPTHFQLANLKVLSFQ